MADAQISENGQARMDMDNVDLVSLARGMLTAMQLDAETNDETQSILDAFAAGGTLSDACGLSPDNLEVVYSVARTCYNNGKYDDAVTMFRFLCFMDNTVQKYWMGLGAALQMLKSYEEAIRAYAYCTLLDVDDARPQLQAGFCLMQLGLNEEAVQALEGALLAPDATDATKLQARALLSKLDAEPVEAGV